MWWGFFSGYCGWCLVHRQILVGSEMFFKRQAEPLGASVLALSMLLLTLYL